MTVDDRLLKDVLACEVYPALGCTEPISCAYAAAIAAERLGEPVERVDVSVDPGTFKNGAAVVVPFSDGARGNVVAAAMGAVLARPDDRLELLRNVTSAQLRSARRLVDADRCRVECIDGEHDFRIVADVAGANHRARCVLAGGHTRVATVERDGQPIEWTGAGDGSGCGAAVSYRDRLRGMPVRSLFELAERIDDDDRAFLRRGIAMNHAIAQRGVDSGRTAGQLLGMKRDGFLADDVFFRAKLCVAAAVDARMAGVNLPVMTSGGSGNQGIVATLPLELFGREMGVDGETVLRSIAAAHLLNAYIKCYVGELSVICGWAMAAGVASAAAIVYQQAGIDVEKITLAVNNVIGDLGGLICDGAKPGCAMKTITAVDTALRSALMALNNYGVTVDEGMVGLTAEESIHNLGRISIEGMFGVDPTVLKILQEKAANRGKA